MTTPWISRPRWTCKYCNITINDDEPSRRLHENGSRHKRAVERDLHETYKKGHQERQRQLQEQRAMEDIERMARQRHQEQDGVGASSSLSSSGPRSGTTPSRSSTTPWRPTDQLTAYGSVIATGMEREARQEQERAARAQRAADQEAEVRQNEGRAGHWESVTVSAPPTEAGSRMASAPTHEPLRIREKAGRYGIHDETEEATLPSIQVKKRVRADGASQEGSKEVEAQPEEAPTWIPVRLDTGISAKPEGIVAVPRQTNVAKPVEPVVDLDESDGDQDRSRQDATAGDSESVPVKQEETTPVPAGGSLFKKRKTGAGAGAKKVRAIT